MISSSSTTPFTARGLLLLAALALPGLALAVPSAVGIPGNYQTAAGCAGNWDPACAATHLTYDAADDVWQGTFTIDPGGSYEYKAALNNSWDVNYGANATQNGPNIPLVLGGPTTVKFYYDDKTHWVTDNQNSVIATVYGSFQSELGCPGDGQPDCLRAWLPKRVRNSDGHDVYSFLSAPLPPATYTARVGIDEGSAENYGAGGVLDGPDISFTVSDSAQPVYFSYNSVTHILLINVGGPPPDLSLARAHWLTRDTIAWPLEAAPPSDATFTLHYDAAAGLTSEVDGVKNGLSIPLTYESNDPAGLPAALRAKYPHLASAYTFKIGAADVSKVPDILKAQVAVSAVSAAGKVIDATSLQIPGVLDDLYTYNGALGATFAGEVPTLRVWAPTAISVALVLFDDANPATSGTSMPMTAAPATGTWSITGNASWKGKYYLYDVEVYSPTARAVVHNLVTDPYSVSLSANSKRTQLIDLADSAHKPSGWDTLAKPALAAPEDIVLYELHVRDFSIRDTTVPAEKRGMYLAFTEAASNGMKHLARLAQAGLTHIHLLPVFDIATVREVKADQVEPADLSSFAPDSSEQQAAIKAVADQDGFNWGYDPYHYTVPEGSYASNPDGATRVLEFRQMVKGLAGAGLRVVMDVVYNHTNSSGQNEKSVLDKVVPGYYHRLNSDGYVERSTCCENTASEHAMMEKLMVDSVVTWAKQYKVDGFRFDIMGHHTKANMLKVRAALSALTPAADGVDGSKIYIYGEGWNFGEVADGARFEQATQRNMAGTGIGTFNDRIRDAARGGGPFSALPEQGFLTGLFLDPSDFNQGGPTAQKNRLLHQMDLIRVSLAGNLKDYMLRRADGPTVKGSEVDYNGQPGGYTSDPQENLNYVSAHDNETLFDAIQLKAPAGAGLAARVRMNNLGLALVALGQGIPFFHAGDELLRSKSLDRNSYNSGDWFNFLDFTYESNNWGVGLPPDQDTHWSLMGPLLADASLKPSKADITRSLDTFLELLKIRKSSRLFRLATADEVKQRVVFHNTGVGQMPGVIVMHLKGEVGTDDPSDIVVVFNANPGEVSWQDKELFGDKYMKLHPVQAESADPVVKTARFIHLTGGFAVPGRTAAVFVPAEAPPAPPPPPDFWSCGCSSTGDGAFLGLALLLASRLFLRRRGQTV